MFIGDDLKTIISKIDYNCLNVINNDINENDSRIVRTRTFLNNLLNIKNIENFKDLYGLHKGNKYFKLICT